MDSSSGTHPACLTSPGSCMWWRHTPRCSSPTWVTQMTIKAAAWGTLCSQGERLGRTRVIYHREQLLSRFWMIISGQGFELSVWPASSQSSPSVNSDSADPRPYLDHSCLGSRQVELGSPSSPDSVSRSYDDLDSHRSLSPTCKGSHPHLLPLGGRPSAHPEHPLMERESVRIRPQQCILLALYKPSKCHVSNTFPEMQVIKLKFN